VETPFKLPYARSVCREALKEKSRFENLPREKFSARRVERNVSIAHGPCVPHARSFLQSLTPRGPHGCPSI
jgi:hypothetical protein